MQRSKLPYFFLGLAAVLAVAALVLLILRPGVQPETPAACRIGERATSSCRRNAARGPPPPPKIDHPAEPAAPQDPATVLKDPGAGVAAADPADLVNQIAKALETGDLATLGRLLGKDALDPQTAERLKAMSPPKASACASRTASAKSANSN